MAEPPNVEAQRTGHKPATIAFPKRARWPGPLQRQVRRRDHGPQAPRAIDGVRARWPATAGQRRPRNDKALADGAPAPPAAGDRPMQISASPDARRPRRTPRWLSRLTIKLSGPATNQQRSRHRVAPCGRVRCSARLGGAPAGRKPPTPSPTGAPSGPRRRGSGDRATTRRSPTGHRRRPRQGTDRYGYRRRRMPRAECTPRWLSRLTLKLSGPATNRRRSRLQNAPCGRVRCSARLDGLTDGPQAPEPATTGAPGGLRRRRSGDRATCDDRRRWSGAARSRGPTDPDIGAAGCREPQRTPGCRAG